MRRLVVLLFVVACGDPPGVSTPTIASATPPYGPLVGGTVVTLAGSGFGIDDRVLVGGREAPLVRALDAETLEVVIPSGEQSGPTELVVLGERGRASATGMFHYSERPTISSVSPADVVFSVTDALVTVTGSGFRDEGAGEVTVTLGGQAAFDVHVVDDTTLTFTAPPGRVFSHPDLELADVRGTATHRRALRYTPSAHPGLLLFPRYGNSFVTFLDLVDHTTLVVPPLNPGTTAPRLASVVRDQDGNYWGVDVSNYVGALDLDAQTHTGRIPIGVRVPAMVRVGATIYAIKRPWGASSFGTFDPATAAFTAINAGPIVTGGGFSLASDGTTVWFTSHPDWNTTLLNTIDTTTGQVGATPVTVLSAAGLRVEEMRFVNGVLYTTSSSGGIIAIDPATGAVTPVLTGVERFHAMEVFE